jgi:hypothetical protein
VKITIQIWDDASKVNQMAVYQEVLENVAANMAAGNLKDKVHLLNYTTSFGVKVHITITQ